MLINNLISSLLFLLLLSPANETWVVRKSKNNISVYTRSVFTSDYKEIKITTKVKASLSTVVKALSDVDHYTDWIYNCYSATLIKKVSDSDIITYQMLKVPWPVTDRDVVSHCRIYQDSKTKVVTISSDIVHGLIPEKDDFVRVKDFHSKYILTPQNDGFVDINYEMGTDPGGIVPAWLVNLVIVNAPYSTQENLNKLIQNPRYKTGGLSFIID